MTKAEGHDSMKLTTFSGGTRPDGNGLHRFMSRIKMPITAIILFSLQEIIFLLWGFQLSKVIQNTLCT